MDKTEAHYYKATRSWRKGHPRFSPELKIKLLHLHLFEGVDIGTICSEHGMSKAAFYLWKQDYIRAGEECMHDHYFLSELIPEYKILVEENIKINRDMEIMKAKYDTANALNKLGIHHRKYQKYRPVERYHILKLVDRSRLDVITICKIIGITCDTYYLWRKKYQTEGSKGLIDKPPKSIKSWNKISPELRDLIIHLLKTHPIMSYRQMKWYLLDRYEHYVGLTTIRNLALQVRPGKFYKKDNYKPKDQFQHKSKRIHEMWQTDFTLLKTYRGSRVHLSVIIDDYSRFVLAYTLCSHPSFEVVKYLLDVAINAVSTTKDGSQSGLRLLTDRGAYYTTPKLREYLYSKEIRLSLGKPNHPSTRGKIEAFFRVLKRAYNGEIINSKKELRRWVDDYIQHYNYHRPHHSLNYCTPVDYYFGRDKDVIEKRLKIRAKSPRIRGDQQAS